MGQSTFAQPLVCFIACVCVLIPIPWHYRSKNVAAMVLMLWLAQGCFFRGIACILWWNNVKVQYIIFGDIMVALQVASLWGMPAAALCITRHLESVASPRYGSGGLDDPKIRRRFEFVMTVVLAFVYAGLHVIVQGHRFDIYESIGPSYTIYWCWQSLLISYSPPMLLSVATSYYGIKALYWFIIRRAQFGDLLRGSRSGITPSRYVRLMLLAFFEFIGCTSLNAYAIYGDWWTNSPANGRDGLRAYHNWAYVHWGFWQTPQYELEFMTHSEIVKTWAIWSVYPFSALLFFSFFGFGQEARVEYRRTYEWVRTRVFRLSPRGERGGQLEKGQLPSFVTGSVDTSIASKNGPNSSVGSLARPQPAMTAAEKWDAGLDLDLDFDEDEFDDLEDVDGAEGEGDESLYDADEKRGKADIEYVAGIDELGRRSKSTSPRGNGRRKPVPAARRQSRGGLSLKEILDEKRSFSSELSASQSSSSTSASASASAPKQTYPSPPRISDLESVAGSIVNVSLPSAPSPAARTSTSHSRSQSRTSYGQGLHVLVQLPERRMSASGSDDDELSPRTPAPAS